MGEGGVEGSSPPPVFFESAKVAFCVVMYAKSRGSIYSLNYIARFCLVRFLAISADASQGRNKKKGDERRGKGSRGSNLGRWGEKKPTAGRHMEEAGAKKEERASAK